MSPTSPCRGLPLTGHKGQCYVSGHGGKNGLKVVLVDDGGKACRRSKQCRPLTSTRQTRNSPPHGEACCGPAPLASDGRADTRGPYASSTPWWDSAPLRPPCSCGSARTATNPTSTTTSC